MTLLIYLVSTFSYAILAAFGLQDPFYIPEAHRVGKGERDETILRFHNPLTAQNSKHP